MASTPPAAATELTLPMPEVATVARIAPSAGSTMSMPAGAATKSRPVAASKAATSALSAADPFGAVCATVKVVLALSSVADMRFSGRLDLPVG